MIHGQSEIVKLMANTQLGIERTKELSETDEHKKIQPLKESPHPTRTRTRTHTHAQNV